MINSIYLYLRNNKRYGLDKPIFVVASMTLAIMFVAVYYASVSGWMDSSIMQFNESTSDLGP